MWCSAMSIEVTLQSKGIVSYWITEVFLYYWNMPHWKIWVA